VKRFYRYFGIVFLFTTVCPVAGLGATGILYEDRQGGFSAEARFRFQSLVTFQNEIVGQIRRLRLRVRGYVVKREWLYGIQLGFSRQDMDWDTSAYPNVLRDAWVRWEPSTAFHLQWGLFKLPGNRQRVVSSGEMQFIDRSISNRTFTLDRDFGIQAGFAGELAGTVWNLKLAVSMGDGRNVLNSDTGLAYTARMEWLPMGSFSDGGDYFEGDLKREEEPKLSLGAGISVNDRARRTQGTLGKTLSSPRSFSVGFADSVFKWRGLSIYGEYLRRDLQDPIVSNTEFVPAGQGLVLQSGYFFFPDWELVARFTTLKADSKVSSVMPDQVQYTLGVNRYLSGHRVKLQADLTRSEEQFAGSNSRTWIGRLQLEFGI
jgi:phosphate-selective porin OprO and OprP